jgi:hypothetical protein
MVAAEARAAAQSQYRQGRGLSFGKVELTKKELLDWASHERAEALRQITLFGSIGVKALLQMPDGTTQDIAAGVVDHQNKNVAAFEALVSTLTTESAA